ncbi:class I SAM-dependent methyltransferase [Nostoc sp. NIES-2111]
MRVNQEFASTLTPGSLILDAGAGSQPYRELFNHCRYEAADFEMVDKEYAKSTYVCDLSSIPVESERFDAIALNQVLEHLSEPLRVLRELRRVLKPGGRMICTAPLFYEEHEVPFDFYRYTQFAWRKMMEDVDLKIEKLDWLEGYFGTVAYQFETASRYLPQRRSRDLPWWTAAALPAAKLFCRVMAPVFYSMDETLKFKDKGYPKNYVVIVHRPLL